MVAAVSCLTNARGRGTLCGMTQHSYPPPIAVIGALNLDVCGTPDAALLPRDSSPGRVTLSAGGVGHNIARQLRALHMPVELITTLGRDAAAELLSARCAAEGIGLAHAFRLPFASSSYLCLHDADGDMAYAVNDMAILERFTPERLAPLLPVINAAPLAVVDANLPAETLEALALAATTPLLLDPVSTVKAERARGVIGRFAAVKPNRREAEQLSGESDLKKSANWFLRQGVGAIFISLGADGLYFADARAQGVLPAPKAQAHTYTGAGDALAAGIALGMLLGLSVRATAASGLKAVTNYFESQGGILL